MATSVLELIRRDLEDLENLDKCISKIMGERDKHMKNKILYEHAIADSLHMIEDKSKRVLEVYADKDGLRGEEIAFLAGQSGNKKFSQNDDVWTNFYDKLKDVKDYHRKNQNIDETSESRDVAYFYKTVLNTDKIESRFTTDENLGKRIDMYSLYNEYINFKKSRKQRENEHRESEILRWKRKLTNQDDFDIKDPELQRRLEFTEIDYITYLKTFDRFHEIPRHIKYREKYYQSYLSNVLKYLEDFFIKQNPLANLEHVREKCLEEFHTRWTEGSIPGWSEPTHKDKLFSLPTNRLFVLQSTFEAHQKTPKYEKALKTLESKTPDEQLKLITEIENADIELARDECLIQRYREVFADVIEKTIEHLQKKQSRSLRELEEELNGETQQEEAEPMEDESDKDSDDEEKPIYNPLNLPLGWDGKPIQYWLYKLHGLGIEYKCEICGNYSYWGRRAFERHFQEWRHAFGMRCLKIPNTVHFKEITKIEEALTLYEKLRKEAEEKTFRPDAEVECEDSDGNVMSARAYEDLSRQGLV